MTDETNASGAQVALQETYKGLKGFRKTAAPSATSDDASEPMAWMRPVPEAMMNDERLDVLLGEFYHSDDGDYVSALGDIRKHVAARESAAATRARAEERERIAEAIEAERKTQFGTLAGMGLQRAAEIARDRA